MSYVNPDFTMTDAELQQRVEAMSDDEQEHFRLLIHKLVMCYGKGSWERVS